MENILLKDSADFDRVMGEAWTLSVQFHHGFVDYTHLFIAALSIDCEAWTFCKNFDAEKWQAWLQNYYPDSDKETTNDDLLPLTVVAERVVRQAYGIVQENGDTVINSVHLLLALLCMSGELTEYLNKKGIIYEDVAEQYYGKSIQKTIPWIPVLRKGAYSRWRKFFITDASKKKKVAALHAQAYELSMYKQYDDCLLVCEAGLSLEPDNVNLKELQFFCFVWNRDYPQALSSAKQLTGDYANSDAFKNTLSYIYGESGQYNETANVLDAVLANNPAEITSLNNRGFYLSREGKYAEAVPYLEKAISLDPEGAYPWNNLGFVKCKLGHIDEGLALINKSLELDKGNSYAYKNKGIIYLEQNDKEKTLQNFQLALRYGYTKRYGNEVLELLKRIN